MGGVLSESRRYSAPAHLGEIPAKRRFARIRHGTGCGSGRSVVRPLVGMPTGAWRRGRSTGRSRCSAPSHRYFVCRAVASSRVARASSSELYALSSGHPESGRTAYRRWRPRVGSSTGLTVPGYQSRALPQQSLPCRWPRRATLVVLSVVLNQRDPSELRAPSITQRCVIESAWGRSGRL
jgi:hypothetical protein